jgi:ATP-dependent 26S proteasome regulatory subunit
MYIGDGAKLIRDAFDLAKEKINQEGFKGDVVYITI